jgi:hypothetical protein
VAFGKKPPIEFHHRLRRSAETPLRPPVAPAEFGCGLWNEPEHNAHPQITLIAQILILESKLFDHENEDDEDDRVGLPFCLPSKFGVRC